MGARRSLLLIVGLGLVATGAVSLADISECQSTRWVDAERASETPEDGQSFETLSDQQQSVVREAVEGDRYVEIRADINLPPRVRYEGTTYRLIRIHADDCGVPFRLAASYVAILTGLVTVLVTGYRWQSRFSLLSDRE